MSTVVAGLSHLEAATVDVLNKGAVEPQKTVIGGQITTKNTADGKLIVGLPITSILTPLAWEMMDREVGSSQGREKRIFEVVVNVYKSGSFKVGHKTKQDIHYTRDTNDPMDVAPPLVTGLVSKKMPRKQGRKAYVAIVQDKPLPLTVLSVIAKFKVTGD